MPDSRIRIYVHFVWATWDRLPLITPEIEAGVHGHIAEKCRELGCWPLEIGGIEDHVHVLVQMSSTVTAALLAKEMKGASSHLVNYVLTP